jgi:hypothetical protein
MNMSFLCLNQEFLLRARFHIVRAAVEVFRPPDVVVFHRRESLKEQGLAGKPFQSDQGGCYVWAT